MELSRLIALDRIRCHATVSSKKRSIEYLSELLAADEQSLNAVDIFDQLTERERLGSTGMGHGVALPHCRCSNADSIRGAFIKLDEGINFDSPDNQPTDLLFALIVPDNDNSEHLETLALLAKIFSDEANCSKLRTSRNNEVLYQRLLNCQINNSSP